MMAQQTGAHTAPRKNRSGRRSLLLFFGALTLVVLACIAGGIAPRLARQKTLLAASQEAAHRRPVVNVTPARLARSTDGIELPGDLQAIVESPIFARADGYLTRRLVDIGDRVRTGQLLAEIETPELDQQINQARAALAQSRSSLRELQADVELSRANLNLAKLTLERWRHLSAKGAISRQERDEKEAAFAVRTAETQKAEAGLATARETVLAAEANLRRLEQIKAFARVTAPFDGVITTRNVDVGTLINAGNGGPAREMFRIAQTQPLRVFVNVPQTYVGSVHPGQSAEVHVQEFPGKVFPARVTRIANALDANSRAMLVILEVPNPQLVLYPGMYAQIRFSAARLRPELRIPGDALMLGKEGPRVAVVDADHVVHYRRIGVGEDLGSEVEVTSGLSPGDLVVSNPTDTIQENARVDIREIRGQ